MSDIWEKVPLQELCHNITDGKHGDCTNESDSGFFFLSAKDIRDGKMFYDNARQITQADFQETHRRTRLEPDDILITNSGTIGRMALVTSGEKTSHTTFQKSVAIIKPKKARVNPSYLYYSLLSSTNDLIGTAGGTAQKNLLLIDLRRFLVPVPSLSTQQKIAAVLSVYDDLIENNTRRIQILEEMARSLYREWFVEFRFPGHKNVPMVETEQGCVPQGWQHNTVGNLVKRVSVRKRYDSKKASKVGTIPILDQGKSGVIGYHNDSPDVVANLDKPVIVFANHTCYQRMIFFPFSAIQNVLPFTPINDSNNIYWLHYATNSLITFNDYKGHWPEFMDKTVTVPTDELTQHFGDVVAPLLWNAHILECKNENLRQTRDLLLLKLVSGEVDVSELDIAVPTAETAA